MKCKTFLKILWLFAILISVNKVFSKPQKLDSLNKEIDLLTSDTAKIRMLLKCSNTYKNNLVLSIAYGEKALELSQKCQEDFLIAESYRNIGNVYLKNNIYEKALQAYNKSIELYEKTGDKDAISYVYISIGLLHLNIGNLNEALKYDELALEISKKTGNKRNLGLAYGNIGATLANYNKIKEAREYYLKALSIFREIGHTRFEKWILGNIGNGYFTENNYKEALEYFKAAKQILENYQGPIIRGYIYKSIGEIFRVNNEFDSALFYYNEALKYDIDLNIKTSIADDYLSFGILYEEHGKNDSAKYYLKKSLNIADEIQYKIGKRDASERLFKYFLNKKECDKFEKYFNIYSNITDSIFNDENNMQMNEAKIKFDLAKNEQEILRLKHEKRVHKIKFYALLAILFLSLIIVILLYTKQKNKIVQNRKIQKAEKELLKLQLKNSEFEKNSLKEKLEYKGQEVVNLALHIIQNIEFIEIVKEKISSLRKKLQHQENLNRIKGIETFMIQKLSVEKQRKEFQLKIELLNQTFFYNLEKQYPDMTDSEKKLAALLRLSFSSKEIASLFNISIKSVEMRRYRLRQKLGIEKDENIPNYLNKF